MTSCSASREGELTRSLSPSIWTFTLNFSALISLLILLATSFSMPSTMVASDERSGRQPLRDRPLHSGKIDAAANELRADHVDDLLGHEIGGAATVMDLPALSRVISAPESFRS